MVDDNISVVYYTSGGVMDNYSESDDGDSDSSYEGEKSFFEILQRSSR